MFQISILTTTYTIIFYRFFYFFFFFLNDTPPPEISPLPLHDALPIYPGHGVAHRVLRRELHRGTDRRPRRRGTGLDREDQPGRRRAGDVEWGARAPRRACGDGRQREIGRAHV